MNDEVCRVVPISSAEWRNHIFMTERNGAGGMRQKNAEAQNLLRILNCQFDVFCDFQSKIEINFEIN